MRDMKTKVAIICVLSLVISALLVPGICVRQVAGQQLLPGEMTLDGHGSLPTKAEQAVVTLGVQTRAENAANAQIENAQRMSAVIDGLAQFGIPEDKIATTEFAIRPIRQKELVVGYEVTNIVDVTVSDLDEVGAVIDVAGSAGANVVRGVTFILSEDTKAKLKDDALKLAVRDVQNKANLLAEELGLDIVGIKRVSGERVRYNYPTLELGKSAAPTTPIKPGLIEISSAVSVTYLFIPRI